MRRVHVDLVRAGPLALPAGEAHHLRDVLRLDVGATIEVFDAAGRRATATLTRVDRDGVEARVDAIDNAIAAPSIVVASAVPKADRADWLVEKLCELGVARWIPLRTARSVVHPEGRAKLERWGRIAIEAAKQSRRQGVMTIDALMSLDALLSTLDPTTTVVLSTRKEATPLAAVRQASTLLIGPEGGWTDDELSRLVLLGIREASLTQTVLRLETAAIVAAGVIASRHTPG